MPNSKYLLHWHGFQITRGTSLPLNVVILLLRPTLAHTVEL
jgi:hypothetical protein